MWLLLRFRLVPLAVVLFLSLLLVQAAHKSTPQRVPKPSRQPLTARQVARQVLPSVVYIEMEGAGGKPACFGSGFFVAPTEILTNKHVVTCSGTGRGRVRLAGGKRSYPAGRILAAPDLDLALVEIRGLTAAPLRLDTSRRLSVGDDIFVAGNPEGLEGTFTRGIVSGVRSQGDLLQIDAPVSPGSSGGPVVDSYGMVVGVTVSSIREGQNLNFAIPAPLLASPLGRMRQMLARLRKGSKWTPGARTPAPSPTSESVNTAAINPTRRTWEANHDWGDFVSELVGDAAVKEELKSLLDSGLSVNAKDRHGRTALHLAATLGQVDLARFLLSRGAEVNAKDPRGRTPMMLAVGPGDLTLPRGDYAPLGDIWIGPLCAGDDASSGAFARAVSWARWYSLLEKRRSVIQLLLDARADTGATDDEGRTSFDYAAAGGITGLEGRLREAGRPGEPPACKLAPAHTVALHGLSLGMTREDVASLLPGLNLPQHDRCGLSYVAIPARRLTTSSPEFDGVSLLRLALLDGRLAYLHVAYEPASPIENFDRYHTTLSARLRLSGRWRRASGGANFDNAHSLSCDGLTVVAGYLRASYVELHDTQALRTLVRRWEGLPERGIRSRP